MMEERKHQRFKWVEKDDGTHWASFVIAGAAGVLAIVETPGKISSTAVIEVSLPEAFVDATAAQEAVEHWIENISFCSASSPLTEE